MYVCEPVTEMVIQSRLFLGADLNAPDDDDWPVKNLRVNQHSLHLVGLSHERYTNKDKTAYYKYLGFVNNS